MTQSMPMTRTTYSGGIRSFLPGRADRNPFLFQRTFSLSGFAAEACSALGEEPDDSVIGSIEG
jgi:hypothetical protein